MNLPIVKNHKPEIESIIGKLYEKDGGIYIEFMEPLKEDLMPGFAYSVIEAEKRDGTRYIKKAEVYSISIQLHI